MDLEIIFSDMEIILPRLTHESKQLLCSIIKERMFMIYKETSKMNIPDKIKNKIFGNIAQMYLNLTNYGHSFPKKELNNKVRRKLEYDD